MRIPALRCVSVIRGGRRRASKWRLLHAWPPCARSCEPRDAAESRMRPIGRRQRSTSFGGARRHSTALGVTRRRSAPLGRQCCLSAGVRECSANSSRSPAEEFACVCVLRSCSGVFAS